MNGKIIAAVSLIGVMSAANALAADIVVDKYLEFPDDVGIDALTDLPDSTGDYVWIPGAWDYDVDGWDWIDGHWATPPTLSSHWVDGYWRYDDHDKKWHWEDGHWAVAESGLGSILDEAIVVPAKLPEVKPEKPSGKNHWVAGYWDWDGYWFWVPGYWTTKPQPGAEWVDGHWQENLFTDRWYWIGGHWMVK
jgi:hypothetical protein